MKSAEFLQNHKSWRIYLSRLQVLIEIRDKRTTLYSVLGLLARTSEPLSLDSQYVWQHTQILSLNLDGLKNHRSPWLDAQGLVEDVGLTVDQN